MKTVAIKQSLRFCKLIHSLEFENLVKVGVEDKSENRRSYFNDEKVDAACKYYKKVEICGTLYKVGTYLVTNMEESEKNFGETLDILIVNDEVYFYVNIYNEVTFDSHYHAYIVQNSNNCKLLKHKDLPTICPLLSVHKNNTHYIAARYRL